MTRLAIAGPIRLNGDEPRQTEIWIGSEDSVAVAFEGGRKLGVLTELVLSWTDDRRLRLTGLDPNGHPTLWEATDPEHVSTRWTGARISWPDGRVSTGATVTGTQHGVSIHADGETTTLPAARLAAVGSQRWIIDGQTRFLASGRSCGCGGKR